MNKMKESATQQIFHQETLKQASFFSSYVFPFPPMLLVREVRINFPRIRLPVENDCFFYYLATIFQFPVVFVTLNIFSNEQNTGEQHWRLCELHLGTSRHLHIYWEHTFLVYNSRHSGVGVGRWERLAGILSPVMRPLSTNNAEADNNHGARRLGS